MRRPIQSKQTSNINREATVVVKMLTWEHIFIFVCVRKVPTSITRIMTFWRGWRGCCFRNVRNNIRVRLSARYLWNRKDIRKDSWVQRLWKKQCCNRAGWSRMFLKLEQAWISRSDLHWEAWREEWATMSGIALTCGVQRKYKGVRVHNIIKIPQQLTFLICLSFK